MKARTEHLFFLLLTGMLASCNFGDPPSPTTGYDGVPGKTANGADVIVCMVNNEVQVYREEHGDFLFPNEEIFAAPFSIPTPTGDTTEYTISGKRPSGDGHPETRIHLNVLVENPEAGFPYKLYAHDGAAYKSGDQSNEYYADDNVSTIKFSRINKQMAAGDFVLMAINRQNDTVVAIGYFDVRFDH